MKTQRDWLVKSDGAAVAIWNPDDEHELWRKEGPDPVFDAAVAVLAPDNEVRELVASAFWETRAYDLREAPLSDFLSAADELLATLKQYAMGGER